MRTLTLGTSERPAPQVSAQRPSLWRYLFARAKTASASTVPQAPSPTPTRIPQVAAPHSPTPIPMASGLPSLRPDGRLPVPVATQPMPIRHAWSRWLVIGLGVIVVMAGLAFALRPDWRDAALGLSLRTASGQAFALQEITIEGRSAAPAQAILDAVGVGRGASLFDLDLEAMRQRIQAVGWVKSAAIERRLPDTLHIVIIERSPFARWQKDGKTWLIDESGVALGSDDGNHRNLRRVVGAGAPETTAAAFALLADFPAVDAKTQALVRAGARRWNLVLDGDVTARLPEDAEARAALESLDRLIRDENILARDVTVIDLRQPDRILVRLGESQSASKPMAKPARSGG